MLEIPIPFVCSLKKKIQGQEGFVKKRLCVTGRKKKDVKNQNFCRTREKKALPAQRGSLQEA